MSFYPELWGAKTLEQMLRRERENTIRIHKTIVDYTPFVRNKNASGYHGPRISKVTAKDLPLSSFTDPAKSSIDIIFNQKKGVGQIVDDIDSAQTNLNLVNIYTDNAVDGLLDAYDSSIINQIINQKPQDKG